MSAGRRSRRETVSKERETVSKERETVSKERETVSKERETVSKETVDMACHVPTKAPTPLQTASNRPQF